MLDNNLFNIRQSTSRMLSLVLVSYLAVAIALSGSFSSLSYATPTNVSDQIASEDGYEIVLYCGQSLANNHFDPVYPLRYCDTSMAYFADHCQEKAFYPEGNICTDQNAINIIDTYIQARGLEGFHPPSYIILQWE